MSGAGVVLRVSERRWAARFFASAPVESNGPSTSLGQPAARRLHVSTSSGLDFIDATPARAAAFLRAERARGAHEVHAIVVSDEVLASRHARQEVRRLLEDARATTTRCALVLQGLTADWPTLGAEGARQDDPMVTAHVQSFLHLFHVVVAAAAGYRMAGGSPGQAASLRLVATKTRAVLVGVPDAAFAAAEPARDPSSASARPAEDEGFPDWVVVSRVPGHTLAPVAGEAPADALLACLLWDEQIPTLPAARVLDPEPPARPVPATPVDVLQPIARGATGRVTTLPRAGYALVSADLHGNLEDFHALRAIYAGLCAQHGERSVRWVLLGDVVHGPDALARRRAPALFDFADASARIVAEIADLHVASEGRVQLLIGAHEHGHLGGPHPRRFWPDEVEHLDESLTTAQRSALHALCAEASLVAVAPCGVVLSHACPGGAVDVKALSAGAPAADGGEVSDAASVEALLRTPGPIPAHQLVALLPAFGPAATCFVHGHDEDARGCARNARALTAVLFGAPRHEKRYVLLELARDYADADDLLAGREVRLLYGAP